MVTLHHIKHKPIGSNDSPLIQKFRRVLTCITDEDDEDCNTSGMTFPMAPLLFRVSGISQCTSHLLPAILVTVKVRLLWQEGIFRLW